MKAKEGIKKINNKILNIFHIPSFTIQATILTSYMIMALIIISIMGVSLYFEFTRLVEKQTLENASQTLSQTEDTVENYLRDMRNISNTIYYNVIKNADLGEQSIANQLNLLYEVNRENIVSIALFDDQGQLINAAPVAIVKEGIDITDQQWFIDANNEVENLHFSSPHIQNIFDKTSNRYRWVISLSTSVEFVVNGTTKHGVLLVDMAYSKIEQLLDDINESNNGEYTYLMDSSLQLIYHPRLQLINAGLESEDNANSLYFKDGLYSEDYNDINRKVIVTSVSYTGWKLVSVIPSSTFSSILNSTKYFVTVIVLISLLSMMIINKYVANSVSKPLRVLDNSVRAMEAGKTNDVVIDNNSSKEVAHLGNAIELYKQKNTQLMNNLVQEQQEQRKTELDALQSQINPHFLYNTLDSIVWMIEGNKNKEAIFMVTQLASLFRISLSKGKTIISINDELKHVTNYINIQKVRFADSFTVQYDIDENIKNYCIVKLVLQPIVENSIQYGIKNIEDGLITIKGYLKDNNIYLIIKDNGLGIPQEDVDSLLDENIEHVHSHGSGVGLINIQKRLQLRFGNDYGLKIESELDEGTTITIVIPAIEYNADNCNKLESGDYYV